MKIWKKKFEFKNKFEIVFWRFQNITADLGNGSRFEIISSILNVFVDLKNIY